MKASILCTQACGAARRLQAVPLLLSLLGLLLPGTAAAAEPLAVGDERGEYPLGLHLEILEDPEGAWTIDDVRSAPLQGRFVPSTRQVPNLGLTHSAFWLRFQLRDTSSAPRDWLLEIDWPLFDLIDFHFPRAAGEWDVRRAGERIPSREWELPYRNPTFRIPLQRGETQTYYVRVEGEDTMLFPLTLWSAEKLERAELRSNALFSLYYGILIGLVAYHLLLFLLLRDRNYLYYCMSASAFALYQLSFEGIPNQYLWPDFPWWKTRSLHVIAASAFLTAVIFTRSFLGTKVLVPRLDRVFQAMGVWWVAMLIWSLFGPIIPFTHVAGWTAMLGGVVALATAFLCWRKGYRPGGYYLLAWFLVSMGGLATGLRGLGIAPSNPVTNHLLEVGVILSNLTLALGLAQRVNVLREELEESAEGNERLVGELQELNVTLEDRIRRRTAELEERTRALDQKSHEFEAESRHKSQFLAHMSHELRTPLNAIIGFSELLREKVFGGLTDKQTQYVQNIHSSGHHLLSLINDVLDLSKIESGRIDLELATFDLPTVIRDTLAMIKERAARRGIKVSTYVDPRIGQFTADERRVKQILINLLSNAVKFTPEGGSVELRAVLGESAVLISVVDTGIGIAVEDQQLIFEEFQQAGSVGRKREGTGLGLALARRLVELHGGHIRVLSEPGSGSTFTFELPLRARVT